MNMNTGWILSILFVWISTIQILHFLSEFQLNQLCFRQPHYPGSFIRMGFFIRNYVFLQIPQDCWSPIKQKCEVKTRRSLVLVYFPHTPKLTQYYHPKEMQTPELIRTELIILLTTTKFVSQTTPPPPPLSMNCIETRWLNTIYLLYFHIAHVNYTLLFEISWIRL